MAIRTDGDHNGIFATINITPLTDIFLVLLIIFMVATAITIESAAHVDLPKLQAPNQNQQSRGVTVTYNSEHQIYVNQNMVTERDLGPAIRDALDKAPEKFVVFDGDPRVILGDMVRILDIAKRAGAAQIALAVSRNPAVGSESGEVAPGSVPVPEAVTPGSGPAPESVAPSSGT
jgi:biopolymer transport protein ExbD